MTHPMMDDFVRPIRRYLPQWAGETMRIDPFQLPVRAAACGQEGFGFTLDRHGAVVRCRLTCGLALSMALPCRAFRGVAARAIVDTGGNVTATLELHHRDPNLCLPLLVADNLDDIAADWHSWSRMLRLPMLIVDGDAAARQLREKLGAIMVEPPQARRRRITAPRHRPGFLRRRKPGAIGQVVRISGEELIARG
jgi:hypothetical protein